MNPPPQFLRRALPSSRRLADLRRAGRIAVLAGALLAAAPFAAAAAVPHGGWSELAAQTILTAGESAPSSVWDLETGLRLKALEAQWYNSADGRYFEYARKTVDAVLADPAWNAPGRSPYADALLGEQLMLLYRVTLKPDYYAAARQLRDRLAPSCGLEPESQETAPAQQPPRSKQECIARVFLAEFADQFQRPQDFPALEGVFTIPLRGKRLVPGVGMPDPFFRLAWSAVSVVDSLASFPEQDLSRGRLRQDMRVLTGDLLGQLEDRTSAVLCFPQMPSGKCAPPTTEWLFLYAVMKASRLEYLTASERSWADRAWPGALAAYAHRGAGNRLLLSTTPLDAKLAIPDVPDASLGAFLLASTEADHAPAADNIRGGIVQLDAWYNSQQRKNAAGQLESFHYKWNDFSDSGYSLFGHMLRSRGLQTQALPAAPTREILQNASFYLIASPDIPVKNPNPHYMSEADADVIATWVRNGGFLILMENDPPNADIEHLNLLADRFGIHFDNVLHHHVLGDRVHGDHVENGRIPVAAGGPLFHRRHTLYMKDTCAISLSGGATALLRDRGDVMMAMAHYGRGIVFANVDPWLYNEYTDGRKTPADVYKQFDNFAAGKELVQWLIQQRLRLDSLRQPRAETHP